MTLIHPREIYLWGLRLKGFRKKAPPEIFEWDFNTKLYMVK